MNPTGLFRSRGFAERRRLRDALGAQRVVWRACCLFAVVVGGLTSAPSFAADPAGKSPQQASITMTDGSMAAGELRDSENAGAIRWQARSFTSPFEFPVGSVNSIHYPLPAKPIKPDGDLCFELSGGDVLFGSLLKLDGTTAEIDAPPFGRLRVARDRIERIYRWRDRADLIYAGPNGLADWNVASRAGWNEEAGQVLTELPGVALWGDFKMPAKAEIEVALSWKNKPSFTLALGVDEEEKTIQQAFRVDVWNDDLVVACENPRDADVSLIQKLTDGKGRLHLRVYLDQELGRCLVFSREGERIADLTVTPRPADDAKPPTKLTLKNLLTAKAKQRSVFAGIRLLNKRGDLRVERLRVARWNGEPPQNVTPGKSRVHLVDGAVSYGEIVGFNPDQKEFTLRDGEKESKLSAEQVATMFLKSTPDGEPAQVRVIHQDGSQVSGELGTISAGAVQITAAGIAEPLQLPVKDLRALIVLRHVDAAAPQTTDGAQVGVLELEGLRLTGRLLDGQEQGAASCLVWRPQQSATASALLKTASGRIVYREPPIVKPARVQAPQGRAGMVVFGGAVAVRAAAPAAPPAAAAAGALGNLLGAIGGAPRVAVRPNGQAPAAKENTSLHLRTGDSIPCEVTQIDEQGVHFKTPLSDASFAAHDKIKALEMIPGVTGPVRLNKGKRERLLTLPRMQKDNPPTHLIRSINGDYLRGRVTSLDEKFVQVEIHLEVKKLPRERVAQIIWLHPDDLAPKPEGQADAALSSAIRVQALRSDGIRMTFFADRLADNVISGKSEVLGASRVDLKDIDQLSIGPAIEQHAARLAFQKWKLHSAIEPKIAANDGSEPAGGASAADSALVGKPAPDFALELLSAKKFQLAEARGKIVVLDFFASWCGPCLQTMPQIDKVAQDFADKDVHVIAVNLEEPPQAVTSMFERHKLSMPVALDRDGAVSAKYGVTSIPQTIVIDREGKVVRHYIGGSAKLGEEVTAVLQDLLKPAEPASDK
ncbi:MAG TPA: TlpA disulfide reductase family protein [Pirellulales bacterium]|jgi:peroxiredoxin